MEPNDTGDTGFDIGSAMDTVASEMPEVTETPAPDGVQADLDLNEETPAESNTPAETAPTTRQPPKSWSKDFHEHWGKVDPKVQEYIEKREKDFLDGLEQYKGDAGFAKQFKEVLTPYKPMLAAAGVTETDAIKFLLNAQYKMTNGTPEQRKAAYEEIGRNLGLVQEAAAAVDPNAPVDPRLNQLQQRLNSLESTLTQRQQADLREAETRAKSEVEKFASDKANAYFEDVASDMLPFINSGMSLPDAYERAVWANPVTRAKEQARVQTETEAKLKENARLNALKARTATSNNIRGTQSLSAPTEPKGNMYDDMTDMLRDIKARAN